MKSWAWLMGGAVGFWLLSLYPGWLLAGDQAFLQSGVALFICLIPSLGTLWWSLHTRESPDKQLMVTLGGSGIRMVTVLGAGCFLYLTWPNEFNDFFWIWLAIFYLLLLALETWLLVRIRGKETIS